MLPVNGSREALFALAQAVIDPRADALVMCPNPFYQIYEGAALAGRRHAVFRQFRPGAQFRARLRQRAGRRLAAGAAAVPLLARQPDRRRAVAGRLEASCSTLSDRYGFVIAADECYSEIYFKRGSRRWAPGSGAQAGPQPSFRNLIAFSSLSKRSNVPGMRSGFVAGDAALMKQFLLYRTYSGGAMSPPVQAASIAAWNDEAHVSENRAKYIAKNSAR